MSDPIGGFDVPRLLQLLLARVVGLGRLETVTFAGGSLSALMIPVDLALDPIHLRVVGDQCILRFGAGSTEILGWGHEGEEDYVLDVIDAILTGHATEYVRLSADGQAHYSARVQGRHNIVGLDEAETSTLVRPLPPWRS